MDVMIELMRLQEQAERNMRDAESVGDKEWAASYKGQAYAFKVARETVRKLTIKITDDALAFFSPKMTVHASYPDAK